MSKLIFRIDDVSDNTDQVSLKAMVKELKDQFLCEVWACVNPFSMTAIEGSVYPHPPFKNNPREFFYDVNSYISKHRVSVGQDKIASHGLFHVDHSQLQYDAQEMSIVGSCKMLRTDIFVPPFNKYNSATEAVCKHYGIQLIKSYQDGWMSIEHEQFDVSHTLWYFHAWRFNLGTFKQAINGKKLGLVS